DVAVIALKLLLGGELDAEIGGLAAALAVLPGTVFALVDRALRPAPEIDPEAAVDLVLRRRALRHAGSRLCRCACCPDRPSPLTRGGGACSTRVLRKRRAV